MTDPREHHYLFAHRVLPQLAWDNPEGFYVTAFTDEEGAHLLDWWNTLGDQLEPDARVEGAGLGWSAFAYDEHLVVSCRFPAPEAAAEAFFATVICGPLRGLTREDLEATPLRYMVLERGATLSGHQGSTTMLCEWTRDGAHLNHGQGPAPELEIFEAIALRMVAGDSDDEPLPDFTSEPDDRF